jgi:hypothetical protein
MATHDPRQIQLIIDDTEMILLRAECAELRAKVGKLQGQLRAAYRSHALECIELRTQLRRQSCTTSGTSR